MKRSREEFEHQKEQAASLLLSEKTRMKMVHEQNDVFPDDICYEICGFLKSKFILKNCVLISKQWLRVIKERLQLVVEFKELNEKLLFKFINCQFIDNVIKFNIKGPLKHCKNSDFISNSLQFIKQLTILDIPCSDLGVKGAMEISKLTKLTSLNILSNKIGDEGLKHLSKLTHLTSLNISYNNIGDEGTKYLSVLKQLTSLYLYSSSISDKGAKSLSELQKLTILDMSSNQIGNEGVVLISTELKQLTELNISFNYIGVIGLVSIINELHNLTLLNASHCKIGKKKDDNMKTIVKSSSSNLTYLDLSFNNIDDETSNVLCGLKQLTFLHISNNKIKLAKSISKLNQLTKLYISCNEINDEGVIAICNNNEMNQLTHLGIYSNQISNGGAIAISKMIQLSYLDVSFNKIGYEGIKLIKTEMKLLKHLDISQNYA